MFLRGGIEAARETSAAEETGTVGSRFMSAQIDEKLMVIFGRRSFGFIRSARWKKR